jgi:glutamate racemase
MTNNASNPITRFGKGAIGVFDSGLGGLSILSEIRRVLPQYTYCYLGDNARVPYGNRSFETVYRFSREAVYHLFQGGCPLVVVACNTASAKALRSIQQRDLPVWQEELAPNGPTLKVLGVLRPTTEQAGNLTRTGHLGLLATRGTVESGSYTTEINHFFPELHLYQQACPIWVPLIEEGYLSGTATEILVRDCIDKLLQQSAKIDAVVLGCTHYPLLGPVILSVLPEGTALIEQGPLVAQALKRYLSAHPEVEAPLGQDGTCTYQTTDDPIRFDQQAALFVREPIKSVSVRLQSVR